ncbi:four helix bundle protein [Maribacter aurantiacus]|uniref:Four helix bundle protein n=1 Tax=Maribacter aurantiacus TaxID=1882343 RepID=A0A5R8M4T0_9FLAO|nr:four helix bundle protein [Maribacter aurantiacus]TLF44574.1 four helix bundle protein [Maribacter aurantiacus]
MRKNELLEVTFKLALLIIAYSEELEKAGKYVIARQIMRSGTSIGANSRESQGAESRADFIHKLKIAYKEAQETEYWLLLCQESQTYPNPDEDLVSHLKSSLKLIGKIISTSKKSK